MSADRESTGLPQRRSCDRCHKQKLRCSGESSENGGVCDRCFRRHARCVYSTSLPKGRPSLARQAERTTAELANATVTPLVPTTRVDSLATETAQPTKQVHDDVVSGPSGVRNSPHTAGNTGDDMDPAVTNMIQDQLASSSVASDAGLTALTTGLMDTAMEDVFTDAWPSWLTPYVWNNPQLPAVPDWHDFSQDHHHGTTPGGFGALLDVEKPEKLPAASPATGLLSPVSLGISPNYAHAGPTSGALPQEQQPGPSSEAERRPGFATTTADPASTGTLIARLSSLSVRLSSLRHHSASLLQDTELPSPGTPPDDRAPFILRADALQPVFAWLAHAYVDPTPADAPPPPPPPPSSQLIATPTAAPMTSEHGILHEVFSASYGLLEILRSLQGEPADGPPPAPPPPPGGSTVIRHLVGACDTMLLEVYAAVLAAFGHDARRRTRADRTIMGDARLVLVVQLCSHLVRCQHRAVSLYRASARARAAPAPEPAPLLPPAGRESAALNRQVEETLDSLWRLLRA